MPAHPPARPPQACFLLGRGVQVSAPRCSLCGKHIDLPGKEGETYILAAPLGGAKKKSSSDDGAWLFFGSKVLVAEVGADLTRRVEDSVATFGDKVLVVMAQMGGENRKPLLFCQQCAPGLLAKVNQPSRRHYGWDWLAELKPRHRRGLARLLRYLPSW
jgi:hypothetical protein